MVATPFAQYNVLLVEDDDADALLIEEALGARVEMITLTRAHDGIEALEHLRRTDGVRPDLIILDLNMPRMNGREVLDTLKHDSSLKAVPVIVFTTSRAPDDVSGAYHDHANAYIAKPVDLDEFVRAVQAIDGFFLHTALPVPHSENDE